MKKVDLKNYFCEFPFTYTEFHKNGAKRKQTVCCPDWNSTNIYKSDNLVGNWNSKEAREIREGHLSGNFKGCNPDACPTLNRLLHTGEATKEIKHISEFDPKKYNLNSPKIAKLCFDQACNLKCPTCRPELIPNTDFRYKSTINLLNDIESQYGKNLEVLYTSGAGDPLYSKPMREFLQNITKEKYPNLKSVILHTNGILLTPKIWESLSNIHPYVKHLEISIDAATKHTYENKVRLNGKWDVLMENLNFIKSWKTLDAIQLDYVVQSGNYKEMEMFCKLIYNIFENSHLDFYIIFQKVWPWPSITPENYKEMSVWDKSHRNYKDFVKELRKLDKYKHAIHNLHEHILD